MTLARVFPPIGNDGGRRSGVARVVKRHREEAAAAASRANSKSNSPGWLLPGDASFEPVERNASRVIGPACTYTTPYACVRIRAREAVRGKTEGRR